MFPVSYPCDSPQDGAPADLSADLPGRMAPWKGRLESCYLPDVPQRLCLVFSARLHCTFSRPATLPSLKPHRPSAMSLIPSVPLGNQILRVAEIEDLYLWKCPKSIQTVPRKKPKLIFCSPVDCSQESSSYLNSVILYHFCFSFTSRGAGISTCS